MFLQMVDGMFTWLLCPYDLWHRLTDIFYQFFSFIGKSKILIPLPTHTACDMTWSLYPRHSNFYFKNWVGGYWVHMHLWLISISIYSCLKHSVVALLIHISIFILKFILSCYTCPWWRNCLFSPLVFTTLLQKCFYWRQGKSICKPVLSN